MKRNNKYHIAEKFIIQSLALFLCMSICTLSAQPREQEVEHLLGQIDTAFQTAQKIGAPSHAPAQFTQLKGRYRELRRKVDTGDLRNAHSVAQGLIGNYNQWAASALLEGPIRNVKEQLRRHRRSISRADYRASIDELKEITDYASKIQKGELGPSRYTYIYDIHQRLQELLASIPLLRVIPDTLLIGDFVLVVESYDLTVNRNFTLDSYTNLSGIGWISFGCEEEMERRMGIFRSLRHLLRREPKCPFRGPKGDIKVRFENVTITATDCKRVWNVSHGLATYPTTTPTPGQVTLELDGFIAHIDSIYISPESATALISLELPPSIIEPSGCRPGHINLGKVSIDASCQFYVELPDSPFGPWVVENTDMTLSGTGLIVDFSTTRTWNDPSLNPALPEDWRGVVLVDGQTQSSGSTSIVSNTGYLKAAYSFHNGLVTEGGLDAGFVFDESADFTFKALHPYGYDIVLRSGYLNMESSSIKDGQFTNGEILLPELAVIDLPSTRIQAQYNTLDVDANYDIYGFAQTSQSLRWGEYIHANPPVSAYQADTPKTGYFYLKAESYTPYWPITNGEFTLFNPSATSPVDVDQIKSQGLLGITFLNFRHLSILTPDTPLEQPIDFDDSQAYVWENWINVASRGIHGQFSIEDSAGRSLLLGPDQESFYVSSVPFLVNLTGDYSEWSFDIRFVESAVFNSDLGGEVVLGGPLNANVPVEEIQFTSTALIPGGKIVLPDTIKMEYWELGIVQQENMSSAGVLSVRTGQIILTAAGITEPRHFSKPFYIKWGEILASGDLGELFFDYNSAGQQFDGIGYVPENLTLSPYNPAVTPFIQVEGTIHFDLFGAYDLDIKDSKEVQDHPYYGRVIELTNGPTLDIQANWGGGDYVGWAFTIEYDDPDQDGFVGTGTMAIDLVFRTALESRINCDRNGICISALPAEIGTIDLKVGLAANMSSVTTISGCGCIKDGELEKIALSASLEIATTNYILRARATGGVTVSLLFTPTRVQFDIGGDMFLALDAGINLEVIGQAQFLFDTQQKTVSGDVEGRFINNVLGIGMEANGRLSWSSGDVDNLVYHSIQGRIGVSASLLVVSAGAEAGFFMGINTPRSQAWVIREGGLSLPYDSNYPDDPLKTYKYITGFYAYASSSANVNLWIVAGGFTVKAGAGVFSGVPGWTPVALGGNGYIRIWGEILGGLVSAKGSASLSLMGVPPYLYGWVEVEGCALWVACASAKLTIKIQNGVISIT